MALVEGPTELTYEQFERRTNQLARALLGLGVRRGDRVGVLLLNSVAFMEVVFATAKLGAIVVPINYRLQAPEVGYILADAGVDVFVYHPTLAGVARRRSPSRACGSATACSWPRRPASRPTPAADGELAYADLVAAADDRPLGHGRRPA